MWNALQYVTSGISLVAFIAACAVIVSKRALAKKSELIQSASEDDREQLVLAALEFFNVDTTNLTKAQQYDVALRQIAERSRRFLIIAILVGVVAVVFAVLTGYAISHSSNDDELLDLLQHREDTFVEYADELEALIETQEARRAVSRLKEQVQELNQKRIDAIRNGKAVIAHEIDQQIDELEDEVDRIESSTELSEERQAALFRKLRSEMHTLSRP